MRRLAAIVALDVVGYSRLMSVDEEHTLATWMELRRVIEGEFEAAGGRVVKSTGDGLLVEAPSVIEAVRAAIRVQELTAVRNESRSFDHHLELRIGVNLGDVIVDEADRDVYGDGVNVAARLEALADPGGIALSDAAYQQVRDRIDARIADRGEQWVKNLPHPIRVWMITPGSGPAGLDLGVAGIEDPEVIGRGGHAVVYRAYQRAMDRRVAVKVLDGSDEATRRRFDRERQAMGRLSEHPGVVTIYESGYTAAGRPFLVMPLLESGSLQDRLDATGPVPWEEAVELVAAAARAVDHAHRHGIIHRDLKPANIMLDSAGSPLVADFGIARLGEGAHTVTETVLTPAYSAPELLDGAEPDTSGDVYALAATLCALITGQPPFVTGRPAADGLLALSRRIATDDPPDLRPYGVPGELCETIEAAMAKDPARRPGTALTFAGQLTSGPQPSATATIDVDHQKRQPHPGRSHPPEWRRPRFVIPAVAGLVAVTILGLTVFDTDVPPATTTTSESDPTTAPSTIAEPLTGDGTALDGEVWRVGVPVGIVGVSVDEDAVFFSLSDGTVDALDPATGRRLWDQPFDVGGRAVDLEPAAGRLSFVRAGSKLVYTVRSTTGVQLWRGISPFEASVDQPLIDEAEGALVVGYGLGVASLDAETGEEAWSNAFAARLQIDMLSAAGDLVVIGDGRWLYGLNLDTGQRLWETGPPDLPSPATWLLTEQVEVESGLGRRFIQRVLAVTADQDLLAIDGATGEILWTAAVSSVPAVGEDVVYVAGVDGELQAINVSDGAVAWSNPGIRPTAPPVATGSELHVVAGGDLVTVNPRSGTELGRRALGSTTATAVNISGTHVIIRQGDSLMAISSAA